MQNVIKGRLINLIGGISMWKGIQRILVIAPHMDDELIGCGGSILKHMENKRQVAIAYVTDGSYFLKDENARDTERSRRHLEVNQVLKALNIHAYFLDIPDRTLIYCKDALCKFVEVLQTYQPDAVYIPHADEYDREHQLTNTLYREACWLASETFRSGTRREEMQPVRIVLEYEVWTPLAMPQYYELIDNYIDKKCELISLYESQITHMDYAQAIRGLNLYRGVMKTGNYNHAEAFMVRNYLYPVEGA